MQAAVAIRTPPDLPLDAIVDPETAAAYLGVQPSTLERWRREGSGPKFAKLGGGRHDKGGGIIRYHVRELLEWVKGREKTSTTQG